MRRCRSRVGRARACVAVGDQLVVPPLRLGGGGGPPNRLPAPQPLLPSQAVRPSDAVHAPHQTQRTPPPPPPLPAFPPRPPPSRPWPPQPVCSSGVPRSSAVVQPFPMHTQRPMLPPAGVPAPRRPGPPPTQMHDGSAGRQRAEGEALTEADRERIAQNRRLAMSRRQQRTTVITPEQQERIRLNLLAAQARRQQAQCSAAHPASAALEPIPVTPGIFTPKWRKRLAGARDGLTASPARNPAPADGVYSRSACCNAAPSGAGQRLKFSDADVPLGEGPLLFLLAAQLPLFLGAATLLLGHPNTFLKPGECPCPPPARLRYPHLF